MAAVYRAILLPESTIANAAKDLRYVNALADDVQVVSIMASAAKQYYAHVEATGHAAKSVAQGAGGVIKSAAKAAAHGAGKAAEKTGEALKGIGEKIEDATK